MDLVERIWPCMISRQNTERVACIPTRFTLYVHVEKWNLVARHSYLLPDRYPVTLLYCLIPFSLFPIHSVVGPWFHPSHTCKVPAFSVVSLYNMPDNYNVCQTPDTTTVCMYVRLNAPWRGSEGWLDGGGFEGLRGGPFGDHVSLGEKRERDFGSGILWNPLRWYTVIFVKMLIELIWCWNFWEFVMDQVLVVAVVRLVGAKY